MEKIVVGMSGGVDSSVVAYLLKKEGYEVIGVTMQMWSEEGKDSTQVAVADAKRVAAYLGIEHHVLDFREPFYECVVKDFMDEYFACRTPNPCILCNRHMKWSALLKWAQERGIERIATGHYANVLLLKNGRYAVAASDSSAKDQTYALYRLTQSQLAGTKMPLGKYKKEEIRAIAAESGIPVAQKPDSQDICFIPDGDYVSFIERNGNREYAKEGNFVDLQGNVVGKHKGLIHYTIGQRKGLNLAMGEPVFVVELRPETNEVVIGKNEDVFAMGLVADRVNYMGVADFKNPVRCIAKIRYAHKGAACEVVDLPDGKIKVLFEEPQRAITPGQSVVFYGIDEQSGKDIVLGGGIIEEKAE